MKLRPEMDVAEMIDAAVKATEEDERRERELANFDAWLRRVFRVLRSYGWTVEELTAASRGGAR